MDARVASYIETLKNLGADMGPAFETMPVHASRGDGYVAYHIRTCPEILAIGLESSEPSFGILPAEEVPLFEVQAHAGNCCFERFEIPAPASSMIRSIWNLISALRSLEDWFTLTPESLEEALGVVSAEEGGPLGPAAARLLERITGEFEEFESWLESDGFGFLLLRSAAFDMVSHDEAVTASEALEKQGSPEDVTSRLEGYGFFPENYLSALKRVKSSKCRVLCRSSRRLNLNPISQQFMLRVARRKSTRESEALKSFRLSDSTLLLPPGLLPLAKHLGLDPVELKASDTSSIIETAARLVDDGSFSPFDALSAARVL